MFNRNKNSADDSTDSPNGATKEKSSFSLWSGKSGGTRKKSKGSKKASEPISLMETPENLTDAEKARIFDEYRQQNPELGAKYELFQNHEDSQEAKKAVTRRRWLQGVGGGIVAVVLLRACAPRTTTITGDSGAGNDELDARTYAAAFTKDWFTWDAADVDARKNRLLKYNPGFSGNQGWNAMGKQTVTNSWAVKSEKRSDTEYSVVVANAIEGKDQPIYAEVAIYMKDHSPSILSYPNIVAAPELPVPEATTDSRASLSNESIKKAIAQRLDVLFKAWGEGDSATLESLSQSSYHIAPILSGQKFLSVSNAEYHIPSDQQESGEITTVYATAETSWETGEAITESTYEVTFELENDRWFISDINSSPRIDNAVVQGASGSVTSGTNPSSSASASSSAPRQE